MLSLNELRLCDWMSLKMLSRSMLNKLTKLKSYVCVHYKHFTYNSTKPNAAAKQHTTCGLGNVRAPTDFSFQMTCNVGTNTGKEFRSRIKHSKRRKANGTMIRSSTSNLSSFTRLLAASLSRFHCLMRLRGGHVFQQNALRYSTGNPAR